VCLPLWGRWREVPDENSLPLRGRWREAPDENSLPLRGRWREAPDEVSAAHTAGLNKQHRCRLSLPGRPTLSAERAQSAREKGQDSCRENKFSPPESRPFSFARKLACNRISIVLIPSKSDYRSSCCTQACFYANPPTMSSRVQPSQGRDEVERSEMPESKSCSQIPRFRSAFAPLHSG